MRFSIGLLSFLVTTHAWAIGTIGHEGFLTDKANVLSATEKYRITQNIRNVEDKTTAEIAILTVKTTNGTPVLDYALKAAESWGVGKNDNKNGLFILVAVDDQAYQILAGYELAEILSDTRIDQIIRKNFLLNFRSSDYFSGLNGAVSDIGGLITQDPTTISNYSHVGSIKNINIKIYIIFFFGIILLFILNKLKAFNKENQVEKTLITSVIFGIFAGVFCTSIILGILTAFFLFIWGNIRGTGGVSHHDTDDFGNGSFGAGSFGGFGGGGFGGGGASGQW